MQSFLVYGRGRGVSGRVYYLLGMCVMKNVLKLNKRDWVGIAWWMLVSILVGLLALPVMVVREIYQYKHYHLANFEREDVVRYSIIIILGSTINYLILDSLL